MFAPTNDAFAAVEPATLNSILGDVNLLKQVLTYHVVSGAVPASAVTNELTPKTLAGESLRLNVYGTGEKAVSKQTAEALSEITTNHTLQVVTINGALRLRSFHASNGVIHVIDKVLVPSGDKNLVQTLDKKGEFSTLLTAAKIAGLVSTLQSRNANNATTIDFSILKKICFTHSWTLHSFRTYR